MDPKSTFLFFQDALLTVRGGKMGPKGACTVALNPMTPAAFPTEVGCFRHRGVAGGAQSSPPLITDTSGSTITYCFNTRNNMS